MGEAIPHERSRAGRRASFATVAAGVYAAVTVLLFADVLLSNRTVLSASGLDLTSYYLPVREYGFGELARGRLPLWNPHVLSGVPFLANVQTALFYPPNWVYLLLPAVLATNVSIALHFFLAAWFTSLWARSRTGMTLPPLLAGLTYACSGGYFLHLHPGHVTILCAGVWSPLLLWAMDRLIDVEGGAWSRVQWVVLGAVAVGMPVLAGHPQVAYYSYIAAGLYLLAHLTLSRWRWVTLGLAGAAVAGGIALSAVQLLPSYALTAATTRGGGLSQTAASAYALPAENLLTLVLPHLFGSAGGRDYLGRWFPWEVSLFVGAVPLVLAVYAAAVGTRGRRAMGVVLALVVLAGVSSEVNEWLQRWVPGFSTFRAAGRFGMLADLLLAVLAADGLAAMVRRGRPERWLVAVAAGMTLVMVSGIVVVRAGDVWPAVVSAIAATGQCFVPVEQLMSPEVLAVSLRGATTQLVVSAVVLGMMTATLIAWRRRGDRGHRAAVVLVVVGAANLLWAASVDRSMGPPTLEYPQRWAQAISMIGKDERVITVDPAYANVAMTAGFLDAAGYDSTVLARYVRFLAVSQGLDPRATDAIPGINERSSLFRALRIRQVLYGAGDEARTADVATPLPPFHWVHRHEVHARADDLYTALASPTFDPAAVVLLESDPVPAPEPAGADGTVTVLSQTPERVEIEATSPAAAILLMTDAYAPGWRVTPLSADGNPQERYDLLPADLALRAIPLAAGRHRLRIEYVAPGLAAGAGVSAVAVLGLTLAWVVAGRRSKHRP